MNRRRFLGIAATMALGGCTQLTGGPRTVTVTKTIIKTPEPRSQTPDLIEVKEDVFTNAEHIHVDFVRRFSEDGHMGMKGIVRNDDDGTIDLEVNVRFYDSNGVRIGEGKTATEGLTPDEKWQFQVLFTGGDSFIGYEIVIRDTSFRG